MMNKTALTMDQAGKVNGGGFWEDRWNEFYEDLSEGAALIRDTVQEICDNPKEIYMGERIILKDYLIEHL